MPSPLTIETSTSVPNVTLVVLDLVLFQEGSELLLKRRPTMVLFLVHDISADLFNMRLTNREGAITILPMKFRIAPLYRLDPSRRCSLNLFHNLRNRVISRQRKQRVDMVTTSSHDESGTLMRAEHCSQIRMHVGASTRIREKRE